MRNVGCIEETGQMIAKRKIKFQLILPVEKGQKNKKNELLFIVLSTNHAGFSLNIVGVGVIYKLIFLIAIFVLENVLKVSFLLKRRNKQLVLMHQDGDFRRVKARRLKSRRNLADIHVLGQIVKIEYI